MTTLARLVVQMEAEASRLHTELEKTNKKLTRWEKHAKKSMLGVENGFKALGAAVSVGLFARLIKDTLNAGDQIQKLSTRIGASTEALSEYQHVANLTGVSFQSLATAWQRQTRRISEATQGTGEAVKALDELGLSAQALNQLKPEQQFEVLAEALNGVEKQSDKVRLAMKFWDTEGVALLQTAEGGAQALAQMREEARQLGLSLGQEQVNQMAAAKDAMARMSSSANALANTLAVQLAPHLENIFNWLSEAMPSAISSNIIVFAELARAALNTGAALAEFAAGQSLIFSEERRRAFLESALEMRVAAAEWADVVIREVEKLNKPIAAQPGSPLALITGQAMAQTEEAGQINVIFDNDILAANFEERLSYLQEHQQIVEETIREHHRRVAQVEREAMQSRLSTTASILGSLSALVAGQSRSAFEASKAFAYAETIVSTYAAAQLAFHNTLRIPGIGVASAWAAAGAAVLGGLARAKAISDTQFGGGGTAATTAGGATPVAPVSPATGFPAQEQETTINLIVDGEVLGRISVKGVVQGLQNDEFILRDETTFNRVTVV